MPINQLEGVDVNAVSELMETMRLFADLMHQEGPVVDDVDSYLPGLLLALAGLASRGELSQGVAEILLSPYDHDDVVLAAFGGADASQADLYACTVALLAGAQSARGGD